MSESDIRDAGDEMFEQREYWKKRCEVAEYAINGLLKQPYHIKTDNVLRRLEAWRKIKSQGQP